MKLCLVLAVLFYQAIVSATADDTAAAPAPVPATSTAQDQIVCYKSSELTTYCPACTGGCSNLNNCPCTFSDGTVIQPKVITATKRPPYCPSCPLFKCLVVVRCDPTKACTAAQLQALVNK